MYINLSSIISSLLIPEWVNCVHMKPTNINKLKYNPYMKVTGVLYRNISLTAGSFTVKLLLCSGKVKTIFGGVPSSSQKNRLCKTVLWFLFIKSKCKSRFNQMLVKASRGESPASWLYYDIMFFYLQTSLPNRLSQLPRERNGRPQMKSTARDLVNAPLLVRSQTRRLRQRLAIILALLAKVILIWLKIKATFMKAKLNK